MGIKDTEDEGFSIPNFENNKEFRRIAEVDVFITFFKGGKYYV